MLSLLHLAVVEQPSLYPSYYGVDGEHALCVPGILLAQTGTVISHH